jgi:hypothetical protein
VVRLESPQKLSGLKRSSCLLNCCVGGMCFSNFQSIRIDVFCSTHYVVYVVSVIAMCDAVLFSISNMNVV